MSVVEANYTRILKPSQSHFLDSAMKKNGRFNKSFNSGGGVNRLYQELSYPFEPFIYNLKYHHLGIDKEFAASYLIRDHYAVKAWKIVIRQFFDPPYFWKLEVGKPNFLGKLGLLHAHIIADVDAGLLHLPRTGEIVKPITDFEDYKRRMKYLYKPSVPKCQQGVNEYLDALQRIEQENKLLANSKRHKSVPQTSGFVWE